MRIEQNRAQLEKALEEAQITAPQTTAECIRTLAETPRDNFIEEKCSVSRGGDMLRSSAPAFKVKATLDPLPDYHWSVCIRRNYQSAQEHKVRLLCGAVSKMSLQDRCIPYFGEDDETGVDRTHLDDSDSDVTPLCGRSQWWLLFAVSGGLRQ